MHDFVVGTRREHVRLRRFRAVLEAHEYQYLGAERTLVKADSLFAATMKERIRLDFHCYVFIGLGVKYQIQNGL
jgi:hypothetical protein